MQYTDIGDGVFRPTEKSSGQWRDGVFLPQVPRRIKSPSLLTLLKLAFLKKPRNA